MRPLYLPLALLALSAVYLVAFALAIAGNPLVAREMWQDTVRAMGKILWPER